MKNNYKKDFIISTYKCFVYLSLYLIFMLVMSKINYALLTLTRTMVITSSAFFLVTFMIFPVYGNFNIGGEKSKPVFLSTMITMFITNILAFITLAIMGINQFPISKIILPGLLALIVTYILQAIAIWVFAHLGNSLYFKMYNPAKTIIIDNNETIYNKVSSYIKAHDKQYKLIKTYKSPKFEDINFKGVDHVFLLNYDPQLEKQMVEYCYYNDLKLTYNANTYNILLVKRNTTVIDDVLMVEIFPMQMTLLQLIIKRIIDIIGACLILIVTSPIFLFVTIAIKMDDGGPVFFRQQRLTKNGKTFNITKFRSMKQNSGDVPATENDSRITPIGEKLRKYRIDELPQMVNILSGDMSLVGPRPESVSHAKVIKETVPEFDRRLKVKAGLTGYAQIFGKYNTSPKMKLRLDINYIENFSILDDIKLLLQTLFVFFRSDSTEGFDDIVSESVDK